MNIPNKLTTVRIVIAPFFIYFLLSGQKNQIFNWMALIIFIISAITDMLDGWISRKFNMVTNFGKIMDPVADKVLISSALICLVYLKFINPFVFVAIITREFMITSFRIIAADKNIVIAANKLGKIKTISQIFTIIMFLIYISLPIYKILLYISNVFLIFSVIITIISGIKYIMDNKCLICNDI